MYHQKKIIDLLQKIEMLEKLAIKTELDNKALLKQIYPDHADSARNLLHYLAIRSQDMSTLQKDLSEMAISSNSHSESYTLDSLEKIRYLLSVLAGIKPKYIDNEYPNCKTSVALLKHNATALLGAASFEGQTKVMVTLPTEAGADYGMVLALARTGMHIARINTAHDDPGVWKNMIDHVKKAGHSTGKKLKVYMDLEGPKIRTGKIAAPNGQKDKIKPPYILLYKGSTLTLTKATIEGYDGEHPIISLTSTEVFGCVKCNERVWFDDGKLGGVIISADNKNIVVEITMAPEEGFKLKAEKGVNFPDSNLDIPAFTKEDLEHLPFIAQHADMVGYSFIQRPDDIIILQEHLKHLKREDLGIILKIETHLAFENLPVLLLTAMRSQHCGIMIARGDLAVAIGYLRMAEVQEEILWLAEAAHLPVIWATQVLETQIKNGIATRAEISDVVKSVRAECVMLNKGAHILEAIKTVKDIDKRMAAHEDKKRKILRSLHVAKAFLE
ncbi:MAG: pyruvate kinase [Flavipsychrobacter sp.]|nr:pyruvate kinase [Flavipsychrobacter sp.]